MAAIGLSHNFDAARSMLPVMTAAELCIMTRSRHRIRIAALAALPLLLLAGAAAAQEQRSSPGFLDNLFSRGEQSQPQGESQVHVRRGGDLAQADPGDLSVRLDRME